MATQLSVLLSGRVWDKLGGSLDRARLLPLPAVTGLVARVSRLSLGRLETGEYHAWDLSTIVGTLYRHNT